MGAVREQPGSFEQYVAAHTGELQAFAFLVVGNHEDARDALQDALLSAYKRWNRLEGDVGPYLRRCIVNAKVSAWRKRRRETPVDRMEAGSLAGPGVETLWVEQICRDLPRKQRAAVMLRFYEDRSFAEIGEVLDCSEATARSLLHRAVGTLRQNLNRGR